MGNLIPQNYNIWMGNSPFPSSSGLHHDYHDNLYVLLRGTKRIFLYTYEDALNLYTNGKIDYIHPNGRINYEQQRTNADGSSLSSLRAMKVSVNISTDDHHLIRFYCTL